MYRIFIFDLKDLTDLFLFFYKPWIVYFQGVQEITG